MLKLISKLFTLPKEDKANLRAHLQTKFVDELIDFKFNNVGTYHGGSRTKVEIKMN